jgi:DNA-binding response OmpR family regulator
VLSRRGFDVRTADDGLAGAEDYCANPTDVVIIDIIMPRSDGIATIKRIREHHPHARIIAMTGGGNFWPSGYKPDTLVTDAYLTLASQSGADVLMRKPFQRQALIDMVQGLMKR